MIIAYQKHSSSRLFFLIIYNYQQLKKTFKLTYCANLCVIPLK
ncbi:hypothetical protein VDIAB_100430 [Vibrio diabolicus]|nr:hypothetical protein VDIAB_100430 [Vibrio diabolicus]